MPTYYDFSAVYTGPTMRAWLNCSAGSCDLELQTLAEPGCQPYHRAVVEVLVQPRGNDGLAQGGPIAVCRQTVSLHVYSGGPTSWGYCRLPPGFDSRLAARCYLRVQPEKAEPPKISTTAAVPADRSLPPAD